MKEGRDRIDKRLRWRPILAFFCMLLVAAALSPVVAYASEGDPNVDGGSTPSSDTPAPTVIETPTPATDPEPGGGYGEGGYSDELGGGDSNITDPGDCSDSGNVVDNPSDGNGEGDPQTPGTTDPDFQGEPVDNGEGNGGNTPTTDPDPNAGNTDGTGEVTNPSDPAPDQGTNDPKEDEGNVPEASQANTPTNVSNAGANGSNSTITTPAMSAVITNPNTASSGAPVANDEGGTAPTTQTNDTTNQATTQDHVVVTQEVSAADVINQDALYQALASSIQAEAGQSTRPVDMVFMIDTTRSMWDNIDKVRSILQTLVQRLEDDYLIDLNMAVVSYRDYFNNQNDAVSIHTFHGGYWSYDVSTVQYDLRYNTGTASDGNGDEPETPTYGIRHFLDVVGFRSYADRFLFLLTDAGYKEGGVVPTMSATIGRLKAAGIHAIVVATEYESGNTNRSNREMYRGLYEGTDGAFIDIDGYTNNEFASIVAETIIGLTKKSYDVQYSDMSFADVIYTGSYLEPSLVVMINGKTLREGYDYTVKWGDNVNAGSDAYAIVTGCGLYEGSKTAHFIITAADIAKCALAINSVTYSGSARTPLLARATYRGMNLVRGTDYYIVSYSNNINAGTGYATICGKGNYRGTAVIPFVINPAQLNWSTVTMPSTTYNGHERTPMPTNVTWSGMTLVRGRDYTVVAHYRNVNANDGAYVVLEGLGNYAGRKTADFLIRPAQISWATFHMPTPTYSGRALTPNPSKVTWNDQTLKQDRDFTVLDYYRNVNVGEGAYAVIEGTGNYTGRTTAPFDINPRHISVVQFEMPDVVYSGKARTPVPVSTHWYGNTIKRGRDYDMTAYYRNTNANDSAYAVIDGRGNYTGRTTVSFWIQPAHISWADIGMHDVTYNGNARTPSTAWAEWNEMSLKKGRDYTIKAYYHNVNASEDDAYAVIEGKGNYKGRTSVYFEIYPARIPWATIVMPTRTYNGSAQTPAPSKITWNGMTLEAGRDFRVVGHYRNVNAGSDAYVVIDGIGNYAGRTTSNFTIKPASFSGASVYMPTVGYNGAARTPAPTSVWWNGMELVRGRDYKMTAYYRNVNANGGAYAVLDGIGNFVGRITQNFTITKTSVQSATISGISDSASYNGGSRPSSINPVLKIGNNLLKQGKDYTVTYKTSSGAIASSFSRYARYQVIIQGINSMYDTITKWFYVS